MRPLPILLAGFLVAGCGAAPSAGGPPSITLTSSYGDQDAVPGSYCLDRGGGGECADSPAVHPKQVTVVADGDQVALVFADATVVRSSGCHSAHEQDCIGSIAVRPLGCQEPQVDSLPLALGPQTTWTVDLEPGAYQLDVHGYFTSSAGTGDLSGTLGLLVVDRATVEGLGVSQLQPSMQVCPIAVATE